MKLLWSFKMHGFLTHLKGLLPPLQQLTDQHFLQRINHFTPCPQAFLPQHSTRSNIPSNNEQVKINLDHDSLQQGSGPSERLCNYLSKCAVDHSCGHSPGHILQLFKAFGVLSLQTP